jgi:hypothetical protein
MPAGAIAGKHQPGHIEPRSDPLHGGESVIDPGRPRVLWTSAKVDSDNARARGIGETSTRPVMGLEVAQDPHPAVQIDDYLGAHAGRLIDPGADCPPIERYRGVIDARKLRLPRFGERSRSTPFTHLRYVEDCRSVTETRDPGCQLLIDQPLAVATRRHLFEV